VAPEVAGPLFRKAGARWTLANFLVRDDENVTKERLDALAQHKVGLACANVACIANTCNLGDNDVDAMIRRMHAMPPVENWLVFWETSLSRDHESDFPFDVIGKPVRPLTDDEEKVFQNCWNTAVEYAKRVRAEFPGVKLIYGNGHPNFIAALLRRGFPKEYIDGFGLDFAMFTSSPELQPGQLHCAFSGLYFLKALQDIHGYSEVPRYLTEAIYCSQSEGWLTERQQADHYVRSHLLGLASGVVLFGMTTELWDPGSEFFFGGYGPVGLCHRAPELNPRESFCAYSTMTRMLDQAEFEEMLSMPSPSTYGLCFGKRNGCKVYAFWTPQGERTLTLTVEGSRARIFDLFGNVTTVQVTDGVCSLSLNSSPQYVEGVKVTGMTVGAPKHRQGAKVGTVCIKAGDFPKWRLESNQDPWLQRLGERGNWAITSPTIKGKFAFSVKENRTHGEILRVELLDSAGVHPLYEHYAVLRFPKPIPVDEGRRALGVWIRGNSSSGRILYEFEDSAGKVWRSIYGDTYIDFDGWRYVQTLLPVPAEADGSRLQASGFAAWATDGDDKVPAFPIALTGLAIESRTHVVRATTLEPVPDRTFDIGAVVVTDEIVDREILYRW
jgi:hypothetical protein